MTKKNWVLLLLFILLLVGYIKLFYKTYSETTVAKTADYIIALDTKRITNTFIWNIITTPSQWKFSSSSDDDKDKVSLEDMVRLPDYVFVFHSTNHPLNAWYTVLEIKDKDDFAKGLQQFHFEKKDGLSASKELGIEFIQSGDQLLVGNIAVEDKNFIRQIADELFTQKKYAAKDLLKKNIDAASHLSVQITKNNFLQEEWLISANFDKAKIVASTGFTPKFNTNFAVNNFMYSDSSLCTLAFTQPYPAIHPLLPDSAWADISKVLNFNIDSLLLPTNTRYQLDIQGIYPRVDSAISYAYDDNFKPVEKVVMNTVEEPAFDFTVQGVDVSPVYNYWKSNSKLEQTAAGELFTPIPFVKSYCSIKNETQLAVTSNNYKAAPAKHSVQCILFFKLMLTKIPPSLMKYLPDEAVALTKNMESLELTVNNEKGQIIIHCIFNKKKNDLPIIEW